MNTDTRLWEKDSLLMLDFNQYLAYDDIPIIAEVLEKYFNAKFVNKLDGPAERVWFLEIDGAQLALQQIEGYGCFLKATEEDAKIILKEIKDQWHLYSA
jgi:hypothetical protein